MNSNKLDRETVTSCGIKTTILLDIPPKLVRRWNCVLQIAFDCSVNFAARKYAYALFLFFFSFFAKSVETIYGNMMKYLQTEL